MANTKKGKKDKKDKDLLARLADAGEDAIIQLTKTAAGKAVVDAANQTRARIDDLSKRMRGVEELEGRVAALEKQLAALTKKTDAAKPAARKPRKPAATKPAAAKPAESEQPAPAEPAAGEPPAQPSASES